VRRAALTAVLFAAACHASRPRVAPLLGDEAEEQELDLHERSFYTPPKAREPDALERLLQNSLKGGGAGAAKPNRSREQEEERRAREALERSQTDVERRRRAEDLERLAEMQRLAMHPREKERRELAWKLRVPVPERCDPDLSPPGAFDCPSAAGQGGTSCVGELLGGDGSLLTAGTVELAPAAAHRVAESTRAPHAAQALLDQQPELARLGAVVALHRLAALDAGAAAAQCAAFPRDRPDRNALLCAFRASAGLGGTQLAAHWAGCRCGFHGRKLGDACIDTRSDEHFFDDLPIDPRLVDALARFVTRLDHALEPHGMRVDNVGLVGCTELRFERGAQMRGLDREARARLDMNDLSNHSFATACDLRYLTLRRSSGGGAVGFAVRGFTLALMERLGVPDDISMSEQRKLFRDRARQIVSRGIGAWYRALPDSHELTVFTIGALARNALVDAGLVVYDPLVNGAHEDHFHFHVPIDPARAAELARQELAGGEREKQIAEDLRRAAGLL
jgi:hypothetical protein